MLTITIEAQELFDEAKGEFLNFEGMTLELEHSLVSLSKWESKFQKPFLNGKQKTAEEVAGYIEAMILDPVYPENFWDRLSSDDLTKITDYIESPQTGTTFGEMPERKGRGENITSELIYFWLVSFKIPFEVERWHLNRLFALIRICNIKNAPPKKVPKNELARRNRELNAQRRAQLGTSG